MPQVSINGPSGAAVTVQPNTTPVAVTPPAAVAPVVTEVDAEIALYPQVVDIDIEQVIGGGVGAPQNVFVQEANPNMTGPGVWFELRSDGTLKTIWVENGA